MRTDRVTADAECCSECNCEVVDPTAAIIAAGLEVNATGNITLPEPPGPCDPLLLFWQCQCPGGDWAFDLDLLNANQQEVFKDGVGMTITAVLDCQDCEFKLNVTVASVIKDGAGPIIVNPNITIECQLVTPSVGTAIQFIGSAKLLSTTIDGVCVPRDQTVVVQLLDPNSPAPGYFVTLDITVT